jgi:NADP-dependent 3-hydroxy acid dehydrogenase YdfG
MSPTMAVYAATKNAVRTLSEGLRIESEGKYRVTGISPGFVGTNFAGSMTDPGVKAEIQKRMDEIALEPVAIARAMGFAIEQPDHVDVGDIVVRPTVQN